VEKLTFDALARGWAKSLGVDRKQFNMFFDRMMDGFAYQKVVVDKDGKPVDYVFLEVNSAFEGLTGLKKEKIIGRKVTEVLKGIESDPADLIGSFGRVALTGEPAQFVSFARTLGRWYRISAYCPEKGYFVSLFEDVTEQKKIEEQLRLSEERFFKAFQASPEAMAIQPVSDARFIYVNESFTRLFEYSRDEVIGHTSAELNLYVYPERREQLIQQLAEQGSLKHFENVWRTKSGRIVPLLISVEVIVLNGQEHYLSVLADVSEVKKAEEALRVSEENYRHLLQYAPTAIYEIDYRNQRFKSVNDAVSVLTGYSREELLAMNPADLLDAESRARFQDRIRRGLAGEKIEENVEYRARVKDGRELWVVLNVKLISKDGKFDSALVVGHDITERKKAEESLKRSQEIAHLGSWELDLKENKLTWSDEVYRIFGLKPQEFGATYEAFLSYVHPDDRAAVDAAYSGSLREGKDGYEIEHRIVRKDSGEVRVVHEKCTHARDDSGQIVKSLGMVHDITELKKAEEALVKSEQRWATTLASIGDAVIATDVLGNIMFMNKVAEELTGWTLAEVSQKPLAKVFNIINETTRKQAEDPVAKVLVSDMVVGLANHTILVRKDGSEVPIDDSGAPIVDAFGKVTGAVLVFRDITARRSMEKELVNLSKFPSENPDPVFRITQNGIIVYANPQAQKFSGLIKTQTGDLAPKKWQQHITEAFHSNSRVCFEETFGDRVFLFNVAPILSGSYANLYGSDITERKKAIETIQESEVLKVTSSYARTLIEASPDPLVTINAEGKITDVNKATEDVTGYAREQLIGSDFSDYFTKPEEARKGYQQVFNEGFVKDYPLAIRHKSGKITDVLYNATVYRNKQGQIQGIFAAARDITERKKAEELARECERNLKDAERLAAIGTTAGMVGHDIRNPLQSIVSELYLAKTELTGVTSEDVKNNLAESIANIENEVDYINKIVQDLQDFAKPLKPVPSVTNIRSIVKDILTKNHLPDNVDVSCRTSEQANQFVSDPDLLKRIIANLISNGVQAMPKGGKLSVRANIKAGDLFLSVEDTGVGIPEEVRSKLFTPLFTTKSKGQGFGLSVVKRMAEALGGTVTFESEVGEGTKFIIRLPRREIERFK
jgi:PAS domain S-box-containing protein